MCTDLPHKSSVLFCFFFLIPRGKCLFIPSGQSASSSDLEQIKCCLKCLLSDQGAPRGLKQLLKRASRNSLLKFWSLPIPRLESYCSVVEKSSHVVIETSWAPGCGTAEPVGTTQLIQIRHTWPCGQLTKFTYFYSSSTSLIHTSTDHCLFHKQDGGESWF